jgi:hypothetical protein
MPVSSDKAVQLIKDAGALTVKDEGVSLGSNINSINIEGASVTATGTGQEVTVSIVSGDAVVFGAKYIFSPTTTSSPANGEIRLNNSNLSLATEIYVSETDRNAANTSGLLDFIQLNSVLAVVDESDTSNYHFFSLNSQVDNGTDRTYNVTHLYGNGTIAGNTTLGASVRGPQGIQGEQGNPGVNGITGFGLRHTFSTSTSTSPAAGEIRLNNATPSLATNIYISEIDRNGNATDLVLDELTLGSILMLIDESDSTSYSFYRLDSVVDNVNYRDLTVAHLGSNGTLSGNITFSFASRGPQGPSGSASVDLSVINHTDTNLEINNTGGQNISIGSVTNTLAGLMSSALKIKLDSIQEGSQVNRGILFQGISQTYRSALNFTGGGVTITDDDILNQTVIDIAESVPPSRTVSTELGLEGGGALSTNITISLTAATLASLALADSSLQASDIGSTIQSFSTILESLSSLTLSANQIIYSTGATTFASSTISALGRTLLSGVDVAAMQATLSLRPGTEVQPYSSKLSSIVSGFDAATEGQVLKKVGSNLVYGDPPAGGGSSDTLNLVQQVPGSVADPGGTNTTVYAGTDGKLYYRNSGGVETEIGSGGTGGTSFQSIHFYATKDGGQTIASGSNVLVDWDTPTSDTEVAWDPVNNEWEAQEDCYLQVSAAIHFDNEDNTPVSGRCIIILEKKLLDSTYIEVGRSEVARGTYSDAETIPVISSNLSLVAGERIRILAHQGSGLPNTVINFHAGRGFFSLLGWRKNTVGGSFGSNTIYTAIKVAGGTLSSSSNSLLASNLDANSYEKLELNYSLRSDSATRTFPEIRINGDSNVSNYDKYLLNLDSTPALLEGVGSNVGFPIPGSNSEIYTFGSLFIKVLDPGSTSKYKNLEVYGVVPRDSTNVDDSLRLGNIIWKNTEAIQSIEITQGDNFIAGSSWEVLGYKEITVNPANVGTTSVKQLVPLVDASLSVDTAFASSDTVTWDTDSLNNTNLVGGVYTAPQDESVLISVHVRQNTNSRIVFGLEINGVREATIDHPFSETTGASSANFTKIVSLSSGDQIKVVCFEANTYRVESFFQISRIENTSISVGSSEGGSSLTIQSTNISFTAEPENLYLVDTTATSITATLPNSPTNGSRIRFVDKVGSFGTNSLTINRSGTNTLTDGTLTSLELNSDFANIELAYFDGIWSLAGGNSFLDNKGLTPNPVWDGSSLGWDTTGDGSADIAPVNLRGPSGAATGGVRQVVLNGPPSWLTVGTGLQVVSSGSAIATIAKGWGGAGAIDDIFEIPSATSWGSLTASDICYLWVEWDGTTVTTGHSTLEPAYGATAPTSPASGQWWFDTVNYKGFSWDGAAWVDAPRVYVGQATTDGSGVTAVVQYAYNGRYQSGVISINANTLYSLNAHLGVPEAGMQVFARQPGAVAWVLLSGGHAEQAAAGSAFVRAGLSAGYSGIPGVIRFRTGSNHVILGWNEAGAGVNGAGGTTTTSEVNSGVDCYAVAWRFF